MFILSVEPGSPAFRALAEALDQYVENMADIPDGDKSTRELEQTKAAEKMLDKVNAVYARLAAEEYENSLTKEKP